VEKKSKKFKKIDIHNQFTIYTQIFPQSLTLIYMFIINLSTIL